MAKTIVRKKDESSDQVLTRFNRASARFVKTSRRSRYLPAKASPLKKKRAAVIREENRANNAKRKHYE